MHELGENPVLRFASAMQKELDENSHKGHWEGCGVEALIQRAEEELAEVKQAIAENKSPAKILSECADVGNFMMMVADNYEQK